MDAVMLIEMLDDHGRVRLRRRIVGVGSQCRIGRSLACDMVLDDVYAAAEHTLLTLQADGRVHVQDLDTRNGTRLDGERIAAGSGEIVEQGTLIVGRTHLQIRTLHTMLPPERVFRRDLLRRHRTLLAALGVAACVGFVVFMQWLDAPESLAAPLLEAVLITLSGLALWTGLWSLVTHLNHGAWQVRIHLAIAANGGALCVWGYWLYQMGAFATQWHWLGWALAPCAAGAALLMMYLHLHQATHMTRNSAVMIAGITTLALGGTLWLIDLQTDTRSVNRIVPGPALYPAAIRIAPSTDVSDYLNDTSALQRAANRNRQKSLVEAPLMDADE